MATVFYESASELAKLTNTFSVSGTPTDPTAISLIVTDPEGTATTYTFALTEITRLSTGVYTKSITCDKAGEWTYEWVGTGAVVETEVGTWTVWDTALGRLYPTVQALRSRVGLDADDTSEDFELHGACFAASRMLENYCQRVFWRGASESRTFVPRDGYRVKLGPFNDFVTVTALATDASGDGTFETVWSTGDYQLLPHNPAAAPERRPYTEIKALRRTFPLPCVPLARDDRVQVTGVPGWPQIPYGVRLSGLISAAELFKGRSTFESQMGYDEMAQFVMRRNPMAIDLIKPYRHPEAAVLVA